MDGSQNNQLVNAFPLMNNTVNTIISNNSIATSENTGSELSELNPYFIEFKEHIRQWIKMDDDVITLNNALKEVKKKKVELTTQIVNFMETNNLKHLNTNDGKLQYSKSTTTKALNKNMLIEKLSLFLKDEYKGNSAADFILENREKTEKVVLKRSIKK